MIHSFYYSVELEINFHLFLSTFCDYSLYSNIENLKKIW